MKVPISWLQQYVDVQDTVSGLVDKLTFSGLEVEAVEVFDNDVEGLEIDTPETVLELEVTPNRPDCLSMIGIAREVAALYNLPWKCPDLACKVSGRRNQIDVTVETDRACLGYTARVMENVELAQAPDWMRRRLALSGIRSLNNVVDITNYVLLETGQPLHAFDFDFLRGSEINVRHARDGEIITTLDGIDRTLDTTMLLICDGEGPIALAGIMGGAHSGICDTTKTILLESACFDPDSVRATSRKLGLRTDSSYRFERGVDLGGLAWASNRAAKLMQDLAGATVSAIVANFDPSQTKQRSLSCRYDRVCKLIGIDLSSEEIQDVLSSVDLEVLSSTEDAVTVNVPSFRGDITREVDLIEEIARLHGLDKIPAHSPVARLIPGTNNHEIHSHVQCLTHLVGLGLREITTISLVSPSLLTLVQADNPPERITIPTPLSQDQSVLRPSLLPQMCECLAHNHARQIRSASLFEIGRVYHRSGDVPPQHHESLHLAIGLMGPVGRTGLHQHSPVTSEEMFLSIKGVWSKLAAAQRFRKWSLKPEPMPVFEEGTSLQILRNDQVIGRLGLLHSKAHKEWRFQDPVGLLELELDSVLSDTFGSICLKQVPTFPSTSRDVALIVDDSVKNQEILAIVQKVAPKELEQVELFDIFCGEGIGHGKKSMAYSFTYRSKERTLTDEDTNHLHAAVRNALKSGLHADLRDE